MNEYAERLASIINGVGEPGVIYTNESLCARDVEIATRELDNIGYELNQFGHPVPK